MTELKHIKAIQNGNFSGLPVSGTSTAVNLTGSWKFFRPILKPKDSPCFAACPLKISIAEYLQEFSLGNHLDALEILRRNNPMPAVTGRVCPNFCQSACNRTCFDEAVLIGDIERALGDLGLKHPPPKNDRNISKTAAIVGSGPAGLAAAFFLARSGLKVTIFEKEESPGGLLRYGIPAYRLPRRILAQEIENILNCGSIELKCNHTVTMAELTRLNNDFDLVIAAPGLSQSIIPEPWKKFPQVKGALEILKTISRKEQIAGDTFVVIGGGNAALDAARSLQRRGKRVKIIYRRTVGEMPAYPEEIQDALAEGLKIESETVVGKIFKSDAPDKDKLQIDLHRSKKSGDRITPGEFIKTVTADCLITAIGQESDCNFSDCHPSPLLLKAGDFAHGAASVAEALASGRKSAESALQKFGLLPINDDNEFRPDQAEEESAQNDSISPVSYDTLHLDYYKKRPAVKIPQLGSKERSDNFTEVRPGLSLKQLELEAGRCFHCGSCTACGICWFFCPDVAIAISPDEDKNRAQVIFDYDHCKGCGQCAEVCPRGVIELEEDL